MRKYVPSLNAVSAVMERVPLTIALIRLGGTSKSRANWLMLIPSGFMKSSRRISPGWIGTSRFNGFIVISSALVIIHDLHVVRIAVAPDEADAPLVIDPDAVRPRAAAFQRFKLVSGRHAKIPQPLCPIQVQKLPSRGPFDGLKSANHVVLKERRGV
jgi:hypothetical protein